MSDSKRIKRLQTLIEQMESGKDVARRDLENALTETEWEDYETSIKNEKIFKKLITNTPAGLKKYNDLLKKADLLNTRAESRYPKGNPETRKSLHQQAESAYEKALEYLSETLQKNPDFRILLDRDFDESPEKYPSLDCQSVPRLTSSTSFNAVKSIDSLHDRKRSIKLSTLKNSLDALLNGTSSETESPKPLNSRKVPEKDFSKINFDD